MRLQLTPALFSLAAVLALGACGPSEAPTTDAGADAGMLPADAGTSDAGTMPDAGTGDAGTTPDAGTGDAGTPSDAGTGDAGTTPDAGTGDAGTTSDAGPDPDAGVVNCGGTVCAASESCCYVGGGAGALQCQSSCADGGVTISCDGPEDCGGSDFCCGNVDFGPGTPPSCPVSAVNSSCQTVCSTQLALTCSSTARVRLCKAKADCQEANLPDCCLFQQGGLSVAYCSNALLAPAGTTCL